MAEIQGHGSLGDGLVSVTLKHGKATLSLSYPRDDEEAAEDMVELVERCEDAFVNVLEALITAAEEAGDGSE